MLQTSLTPVRKITRNDPGFPRETLQIPPPPLFLYIRGKMPGPYKRRISIVGSRRMTTYGRAVVQDLVGELAKAGLIIVSGLALGIDAACHEQALEHDAQTIAVLGGGIDDETIAPKTNARLATRILHAGSCLLSEYAPGAHPRPENFAIRDRIIASLSPATLVIEAAKKSGALITASLASDAGREVWAVPGQISAPQSQGTNNLLRLGAHAAVVAQDILDSYGIDVADKPQDPLLQALEEEPQTLEQIARRAGLTTDVCALRLAELEITGTIKRTGQHYTRS